MLPYHLNNVKLRKSNGNPEKVLQYWTDFKDILYDADVVRNRRNAHAKFTPLNPNEESWHKKEGRLIKQEVAEFEELITAKETELMSEAFKIPNITHPATPVGDMTKAREVEKWGTPNSFSFAPRDHL